MADITEVQLKIKAVEFVLKSFARFSDEEERKGHLRAHLDAVQNLDTYFGFSENKLQDEKKQLQDALNKLQDALNKLQDEKNLLLEKENLLLAQQQGMNVKVSFYAWYNSFPFLQAPSSGMAFQN